MFEFDLSINKKDFLKKYCQKTKADITLMQEILGQPIILEKEVLLKLSSTAVFLQKQCLEKIRVARQNPLDNKKDSRILNIEFVLLENGNFFPLKIFCENNFFGFFFLLEEILENKNIVFSRNAKEKFLNLFSEKQINIFSDAKNIKLNELLLGDVCFFKNNNKKAKLAYDIDKIEKGDIYCQKDLNKDFLNANIIPTQKDFEIINNSLLFGINALSFDDFYQRFERGEIDFNEWVLRPKTNFSQNKTIENLAIDLINSINKEKKELYIAQKKALSIYENADGYKIKFITQFIDNELVLVYAKIFKDIPDENCGIVPVTFDY